MEWEAVDEIRFLVDLKRDGDDLKMMMMFVDWEGMSHYSTDDDRLLLRMSYYWLRWPNVRMNDAHDCKSEN